MAGSRSGTGCRDAFQVALTRMVQPQTVPSCLGSDCSVRRYILHDVHSTRRHGLYHRRRIYPMPLGLPAVNCASHLLTRFARPVLTERCVRFSSHRVLCFRSSSSISSAPARPTPQVLWISSLSPPYRHRVLPFDCPNYALMMLMLGIARRLVG